jgi:hypothetical protein
MSSSHKFRLVFETKNPAISRVFNMIKFQLLIQLQLQISQQQKLLCGVSLWLRSAKHFDVFIS